MKISAYVMVTYFDYDGKIPFSEFVNRMSEAMKERSTKLREILSKIC